jgi:hypothetical protein
MRTIKFMSDKILTGRILIRQTRGVLTQVMDWFTMPKWKGKSEIEGQLLFRCWSVGAGR